MKSDNQKIRALSRKFGLVLLYHSVTDEALHAPEGTIHNVHPHTFRSHLEQLAPFFKFVSLDEFTSARSKSGLAAVTFDDGYQSIIDYAYPVLADLQIPCCSFLNPVTLWARWNWRDKVRRVIESRLEQEFSQFFHCGNSKGRFYRHSKHPDNNSLEIDQALDAFLASRKVSMPEHSPYITRDHFDKMSNPDSLFSYGNHGKHHYVMSSLDRGQQDKEICQAADDLAMLPAMLNTTCFSAPFGGDHDVNQHTLDLASKNGYTSILMSRQQLQAGGIPDSGLQVIERFMPRTSDISAEIIDTVFSPVAWSVEIPGSG